MAVGIKDLKQIKRFILWAKKQKCKIVKVEGIEVEFCDRAWESLTLRDEDDRYIDPELAAKKAQAEEDELKFYSAV